MAFETLLNPIFNPLLKLGPSWALVILSFIISFVIIIIYKYATDQNLMKQLKDELKEIQKELKELKDQPEKAMAVQKRAMQTNMKYMMQSMKATLFTFVPIIIIFGWLNAHLAFVPILPAEEFTVTAFFENVGADNETARIIVPDQVIVISEANKTVMNKKADWTLKGQEGKYIVGIEYRGRSYVKSLQVDKESYEPVEQRYKGDVKLIRINNQPLKVINLFGWQLGWLGTYIILSIVFSMILRKAFKVY